MDPQNPSSFNSRIEKLSTGRTYHFIDEKPSRHRQDTPTILALHGFPDRWYGWRYQIGPWVRRGWRVIAPDMLGYGETDKPDDIAEYTTKRLCADLAALLDQEGITSVILLGHDWGAYTAWRFALWYPDRIRMISCLSIPFYPPAPSYISPSDMARRVPPLGYQLYLGDDSSTEEIQNNIEIFLDDVYRSGKRGTVWGGKDKIRTLVQGGLNRGADQDILTATEFDFYVRSFKVDMHGPLAYYKTHKLRYEEEKNAKLPSRLPASLPALFIRGTEDASSPPEHARRVKKFVPSLQMVTLNDAGHWLMVERKEEVTRIVGDWIAATLDAETAPKSKL